MQNMSNSAMRSLLLVMTGLTMGLLLGSFVGGPATTQAPHLCERGAAAAQGGATRSVVPPVLTAAEQPQLEPREEEEEPAEEELEREQQPLDSEDIDVVPLGEIRAASARYVRKRAEEVVWDQVELQYSKGRVKSATLYGLLPGGHVRWKLDDGHPTRAIVLLAASRVVGGRYTGTAYAYHRIDDDAGAEVIVHAPAAGPDGERRAGRFVRPFFVKGGSPVALQRVDVPGLAAASDPLHLVVPLGMPLDLKRQEVVRSFVAMLARLAAEDGALRVVVSATVPNEAEERLARELFRPGSGGALDVQFTFERRSGVRAFNRGRVLDAGVRHLAATAGGDAHLMFFVDVDMTLDAALLDRLRVTTAPGRSVSFPICFSLYRGARAAALSGSGYWREFGYGMVAVWRADYERAGGFGQMSDGWGGEDVKLLEAVLAARLDPFRAREPRLMHVWHPKDCSTVPRDRLVSCLGSAGQNFLNVREAGGQAVRASELFGGLAHSDLRVYVYDLPREFNEAELELNARDPPRIRDPDCKANFFSHEYSFHRYLLESPARTSDPDKADFFYVPVYPTCFLLNHLPNNLTRSAEFFGRAFRYVREELPYWRRTGGRDHVFLFSQGFGARMAGTEAWPLLRSSVVLTSNGEYMRYEFTPHKDVVIPPDLSHYIERPVYMRDGGVDVRRRSARLTFFGGSVFPSKQTDHRGSFYSLGVRQYISDNFKGEPDLMLSPTRSPTYLEDAGNSTFCLCPEGWHAWTPRPVEAVLLNCIPVLLTERLELPLAELVNWDEFAIRVRPADVGHLMNILRAVPDDEIARRRTAMARAWRAFSYNDGYGRAQLSILDALQRRKMPYRLRRTFARPPDGSRAPAPPPSAATEVEWVAESGSSSSASGGGAAAGGRSSSGDSASGDRKGGTSTRRVIAGKRARDKSHDNQDRPTTPSDIECAVIAPSTHAGAVPADGQEPAWGPLDPKLASLKLGNSDISVLFNLTSVVPTVAPELKRLVTSGKAAIELDVRSVNVPSGVTVVPLTVEVVDREGRGALASFGPDERELTERKQHLRAPIQRGGATKRADWNKLARVAVEFSVRGVPDDDAGTATKSMRALVSKVRICPL